jgi:hypothetical protein
MLLAPEGDGLIWRIGVVVLVPLRTMPTSGSQAGDSTNARTTEVLGESVLSDCITVDMMRLWKTVRLGL